MCTMCMPGTCGDQKKAPDPLELELPMTAKHHLDVGNGTRVLLQETQWLLPVSLQPQDLILYVRMNKLIHFIGLYICFHH